MEHAFDRTQLILGKENMDRIKSAKIIIFGLGGVGGHAFEALIRMGVQNITVVDADEYSETNLNRQLLATRDTIGRPKVDVAEERAKKINENVKITKINHFYLPGDNAEIDLSSFDFVIDAIDTVSAKIAIIEECYKKGVKIISCLGCGNRIDPTKLEITDIFKTENDPLAKTIRKECRSRGIKHLNVVYSRELPLKPLQNEAELGETKGKAKGIAPGSTSLVPSVAGIYLAYFAIKSIFC